MAGASCSPSRERMTMTQDLEGCRIVLLTGEGLRRLLAVARRAAIDAPVIAALGRLRTIVRGPKPVRALREIGLAPGLIAQAPTTEGVIATLEGEALTGRRVGVQLYPGN